MNSIFAGLGIIGLGIFAILIFRRALKEQEIIDAAYKEKQWHLNQKSSLDNGPFDTWWTPEFEAMRKRYGMESPQDDYVAAAQFAADAAALYKKVGVPPPSVQQMMAVDAKDNPLETYETVIMTDPNFGIFESPYANISYMPDYSECEGTAEDAEKIGLKL